MSRSTPAESPPRPARPANSNFLRAIVEADRARQTHARRLGIGRLSDGSAGELPDPAPIRTRFPPEPNGYLHIGHAKSICLNFGLARDFAGVCHLRFDDTNPSKEEQEYVDSIIDSVHWLGFDWQAQPFERLAGLSEDHLYFASDYFEKLYDFAEYLIASGHAYVDSLDADAIRVLRGTLTAPGRNSPFRERPREESLALFRDMRAGRFEDGAHVLRARIDMASPNINLRDPVLYRIRRATHHRTGDRWCLYPMYDYTHCISDALENITHSICTLEFEDHRPLYDWVLERLVPMLRPAQFQDAVKRLDELRNAAPETRVAFARRCLRCADKLSDSEEENLVRAELERWKGDGHSGLDALLAQLLRHAASCAPLLAHALDDDDVNPFALPRQHEFARLNLTYVVLSKRKLIQLVAEGHVSGWNDPRMPTIVGLERRGYTPESLQLFCERIGVAKADSWIDYGILEQALRDDLDERAPRATAVLRPLKLIIDNYPGDQVEDCLAPVHPRHAEMGQRTLRFGRELWIEADDFDEHPPKGYFRLYPGNQVRLRFAYVIECTSCERDAGGAVTLVHARYLPQTRSGGPGADLVRVKGNIHWLNVSDALVAEVRLYDRLFSEAQPDAGGRDFRATLNRDSASRVTAFVEASLANAAQDERFQFERHGYFVADRIDSRPGSPIFNRIAALKDSWATRGAAPR